MKKYENLELEISWKLACAVFIIVAFFAAYYFGYVHGKNKFFDSRYKDGFSNCDKLWKEQIKKKEEEQTPQITKNTKLILYFKSKSYPDVNIIKYTLYNDELKLSTSYNMNDNGKQTDYSYFSTFKSEEDYVIDIMKKEIANKLKEKFEVKKIDE